MSVFSVICCTFAEIFFKQMNKYFTLYFLVAALVVMNLVSCNKNDDTNITYLSDYSVYSSATTLVTGFSLKANTKVLNNLDSVKFAIDQERGLIYNADSLPCGTKVSALLVDLTCASTVSSRQFIVKDGDVQKDEVIDYTGSTNDSIDFTGDVTLRITSHDGLHQRDYKVKVNVHTQDPDVLKWDAKRRRDLPSMNGNVNASKTVRQGDNYLCLVKDNANYVLSTATDPMSSWSKTTLSLPFVPQIKSFAATESALYLLDENGELFSSKDNGGNWDDCGVAWHTIIGAYGEKVLGVKNDAAGWMHDEYPQSSGFESTAIASSFPIEGMSQLVMANNDWTSEQQAMFAGGVLANGSCTEAVWGYDGSTWGMLSGSSDSKVLPKLRDATLVSYFTYEVPSGYFTPQRYVTWMVIGGVLNDGKLNTTTYTSRTQGLYWTTGVDGVQMPSHVPAFYGAQAYCLERTINANSSTFSYNPGNTTAITQWQCPYIYLFGGYASNGNALMNMWEGVLTRLTYKPVF